MFTSTSQAGRISYAGFAASIGIEFHPSRVIGIAISGRKGGDLRAEAGDTATCAEAAPLTANGKPSVLYVGAEWCPNCGATRWPLAIALSRFGTFTNLQTTYSAESHIPTLSFHGSNYTSQYIDFNGKESVDQQNHPLDKLTPAESQLFTTIGTSGYPFIDFGGKWKQNGTAFDPAILSGLTPESVATTMADASSKPGAAIQGSADLFTAMICGIDGGKPANVCTSAGAIAATTALSAIK